MVRRAMEEFDHLGRSKFLRKYGFGESREFFLVEGGRRYDSKAIVGVAHKFTSEGRPLTPSDFSGGEQTVKALLERLGFDVERLSAGPRNPPWMILSHSVRAKRHRRAMSLAWIRRGLAKVGHWDMST